MLSDIIKIQFDIQQLCALYQNMVQVIELSFDVLSTRLSKVSSSSNNVLVL